MAAVATCNWTGGSGQVYTYHVYELPASFDPNQPGNYIYAKVSPDKKWVPIYIGQGDLHDRCDPNVHHKGACIRQKGSTHFHCHLNDSEEARKAEEADLLASNAEAYDPTGCLSTECMLLDLRS